MTIATDWSGPTGDVWAAEWRRTDRSFADLAPELDAAILAAAPAGRHRVVDIGCGAGATSIALAQARPDADILGIDLSPGLVEIAEARVAGHPNLAFARTDVLKALANHPPVDLYCSRHGVMFFADPVAAFSALAAAAAPGARLIFSCYADRTANRWAAETLTAVGGDRDPAVPGDRSDASIADTPGPFAFADPARVARVLDAAGWTARPPARTSFRYRAGQGRDPVADAVDFFGRIGPAASVLRTSPPRERDVRIARLQTVCERYRDGDVVDFPARAWIWSAVKSAERNPS